MKLLSNLFFIIKFALLGCIIGFTVLFFMSNSPLNFNWSEAKKAWKFYQLSQTSPSDEQCSSNNSFADAVEKAGPSVVSVRAKKNSTVRPATDGREGDVFVDTPIGAGSGVILDKRGYIVTNYHVIANSGLIAVHFSNGLKKRATLIGIDKQNDIAVIKVNIETPNVAELGNSSEVRAGDAVMAIGTPFGLFQNSVTQGIVSYINHGPLYPKIQTDAEVNYGNSGGALVNDKGQVIGISRSKFSIESNDEIGINFGIPIDLVKDVFEQIVKNGRVVRNWFGTQLIQLSSNGYKQIDLGSEFGTGLLVNQIEVGSPSFEIGLKPGDYLIEFDGHRIASMVQFWKIFNELPIAKEVPIKVIRNKQPLEMVLKLREMPQN